MKTREPSVRRDPSRRSRYQPATPGPSAILCTLFPKDASCEARRQQRDHVKNRTGARMGRTAARRKPCCLLGLAHNPTSRTWGRRGEACSKDVQVV
jgi:hypothetical protein